MRLRTAFYVLLLGSIISGAWAAGADFYIAPDGSDDNPGTLQAPFATPHRAVEAVEALKAGDGLPDGGVTIWLNGGSYELPRPLAIGEAACGEEDSPVVIRSTEGTDAILSGGTTVPGDAFSPVEDDAILQRLVPEARGNVLQVDLAARGIEYLPQLPDSFRGFTGEHPIVLEVFSGGERMQIARWPNEGFENFEEIVDFGSGLRDREGPERPGVFAYTGDRPERWDVDEGVWMQGYWARGYLCTMVRAGKIDTEQKHITLAVPLRFGLDTWGAGRWFAFNLLEELDRPGEWYLDRDSGVLYFWPPEDGADVTVSMLEDPVVRMDDASYVTLQDLTVECGRGDGVHIRRGQGNRVVGCTVRNVGREAVDIAGGTDHGVIGCDIYATGYGGIAMRGGDRQTLTPAGHFAENNHIHHTSVLRRTHAGPLSLRGVGCRASHNLIHHEPHTAVWWRGNDHVMEFNEIYYVCTETTECGVFYTGRNWTYRGNVIRNNYIHHVNDTREGCASSIKVVHLDDAVSGTTFTGNLCRLTGGGVAICGGPDNVVTNNIFANCKVGVNLSARGIRWWTYSRDEDGNVIAIDTRTGKPSRILLKTLDEVPYQEPPWTKYPHLADFLSPERDPVGAPWYCRIERNISVGEGTLLSVSSQVEDEWVTIQDNWDSGDPGFVNMEAGDFHLREDAPVREIGFEALPLDEMGLYEDARRASWPVAPEPPPEDWRPRWLILAEQQKKMTAVPVFPVRRAAEGITIDGDVSAREWNPDGAHRQAELLWGGGGEKVSLPSTAWVEVDGEHLYVAFVNEVHADEGVTGGQRWGQSDAVEVALAPVRGTEIGDIIVLRGYSNGHAESSTEAGAPSAVAERAMEGVAYEAEVSDDAQWSAEWRIPLSSVGIDLDDAGQRVLFNLSARKVAGDVWAMWKQSGGFTWDVRRAGLLWPVPFGDMVFNGGIPARARIDVQSQTDGLTLQPGKGSTVASWQKPPRTRLTGDTSNLPADEWKQFEYNFTPEADGEVDIILMAQGHLNAAGDDHLPLWVYFDEVRVEGAKLANGGFEELDAPGRPTGWRNGPPNGGWLIPDEGSAFEGTNSVKVWHNGRWEQRVTVTAGEPVTITAMVRAEPKPGGE